MQFSNELLFSNMLSPVVLAFVLGMVARAIRSDLEVPAQIQQYLAIYLLLAIGLKGGVALRTQSIDALALLVVITIAAGLVTTLSAYALARMFLRETQLQAGAMAAHFGSVSAVTFIAAQQFTERSGAPAEGVLVAMVVVLEIPAILLGLALAKGGGGIEGKVLREVLSGRTALLLIGGLLIGAVASKKAIGSIDDMYFELFQGMLMLFMLDMGMVAAAQLRRLDRSALRLLLFATMLPAMHGLLGVLAGHYAGLSVSGATVFGTMVASASYIAAPASVRSALPEADAGRCITAALGITFPFNLAIGIPLYAAFATRLA